MRLQFVTETAFWPPFQGDSARLASLITFLRKHGSAIHVTHMHDRQQTGADYRRMASIVDGLTVYEPTDRDLAARRSGQMDDWCPPGLVSLAVSDCRRFCPDAAIAQFAFLSRCLPELALASACTTVLDADNIFANRSAIWKAAGINYSWFSATEEEERTALSRASLVLAIQHHEARYFRTLCTSAEVMLAPHAHEVIFAPICSAPTLAFIGARNEENRVGLVHFISKSWPRIRKSIPEVRLLIAGAICDSISFNIPGAALLGPVANTTDFYKEAWLAINPCPVGTGLKIKSVEALCHGRFLVTTRAGGQGLEDGSGSALAIVDVHEFANAIVPLLVNKPLASCRGRLAYLFSLSRFTPEVAFGPFLQWLRGKLYGAP